MGRFGDLIGRSPVSLPLLITGKVSYLGCTLFLLVTVWNGGVLTGDYPAVRGAGVFLFVAGLLAVIAAIAQLGESVAVGLPERSTALRTTGLFAFSRNPVYTGAFIMCAGSILVAPHAVNVALAAVAVGIHMRIVVKEEEFLERRFGQEWRAYKARVPRYVGIPRNTALREG